jgi:hypothetical protein
MKTFLHVGCAPKRKDRTTAGFASWNELRFDIDESVKPDLVAAMTDVSSVLTESVDAVFSSHHGITEYSQLRVQSRATV